ncbi:MAG: hypothetical protein AVDCRST_MAG64-4274 [uncultured Phycisphaerae bacterium]|uniref:Uncharacterized protein n=1 Tax=uncultured Phycisphaerae bacterium TaxID=904963 RepID=A0A6J4QNJ8_9BACT|nr:MAG: hypothetical protein AVDCRST_MAG64-4274 [uncultured Phycisphaerae bacterium]
MAVEIMRRELSASALRQAAARSRDANAARRMLAWGCLCRARHRRGRDDSTEEQNTAFHHRLW